MTRRPRTAARRGRGRAARAADGLGLGPGEAEELLPVIASLTDFADLADRLDDALELPRPQGARPRPRARPPTRTRSTPSSRRCRVEGAASGPLAGLTVGIKDNISLAGVPTTNGSRVTPYTPTHDAVVVERILAAGGTIVGKLNMDDFGSSGPRRDERVRSGAEPGRPDAFGGRLLGRVGLGGARGRGRPLARRRPGRQRPHPGRVLRRGRGEGHARARAVVGHHAHRPHDRLRDAASRERSRVRRCCSR